MTRAYLPLTVERLREAWAAGVLDPGEAVVAEADDEESEYAALMTAADVSAELLGGPGRRVVVAVELPGPLDPAHPIPRKRVVAVHADDADRPVDADPDDDLSWYATQEVESALLAT